MNRTRGDIFGSKVGEDLSPRSVAGLKGSISEALSEAYEKTPQTNISEKSKVFISKNVC